MRTLIESKERPILFSAPMVQAILAGRKTMTRRIVKPQPPSYDDVLKRSGSGYSWFTDASSKPGNFRVAGPAWAVRELNEAMANQGIRCPYGQAGDLLWAKETWRPEFWGNDGAVKVTYAADGLSLVFDECQIHSGWRMPKAAMRLPKKEGGGNVSPLFMPRWASRHLLKLGAVRVERLQDISEADAIAEGISVLPLQSADDPSAWWQSAPGKHQARTPIESFRLLWADINGPDSWHANPWVWVVKFKRVEANQP